MRAIVIARAALATGSALATALLGLGCETGVPGSSAERLAATERTATERTATERAAPEPSEPSTVPAAREGEVELDRRADGARLVGTLLPFPPNADPERAVTLRAIGTDAALALDGARVLDARFTRDGVVTIGVDHVLRAHRGTETVELDTGAYGPISVVGDRIAYVRGAAPLLELARADASTGAVQQLTQQMAPCWSPTIAPDGETIVFVSGVEGTPRLYRMARDGAPRALAQIDRTPGSPIGPRFEDGLYVFDDELGTVWVDLDAGRVVRTRAR